jgi:hypothetical protein
MGELLLERARQAPGPASAAVSGVLNLPGGVAAFTPLIGAARRNFSHIFLARFWRRLSLAGSGCAGIEQKLPESAANNVAIQGWRMT